MAIWARLFLHRRANQKEWWKGFLEGEAEASVTLGDESTLKK
jgi:hypothetical protein